MTEIDEIAFELLDEGIDDWVPIDTLFRYAREAVDQSADDRIEVIRKTLEFLIDGGLAQVGKLADGGFKPVVQDSIIEAVLSEGEAMSWTPHGASFWLSNTPKGDEWARANG